MRRRSQSAEPLARAESRPADESLFATQLGRLGGTIYQLGRLDGDDRGRPMVPMSLLNQLRRELVARLDAGGRRLRRRGPIAAEPVLPALLRADRGRARPSSGRPPTSPPPVELAVLCRRTDQIEAAVAPGIRTIYADYQDIKQYAEAVAAARRGERVDLPGDPAHREARRGEPLQVPGQAAAPTASWSATPAGMRYCSEHGIPFVADFSMNAANPLTVELLKAAGRSA